MMGSMEVFFLSQIKKRSHILSAIFILSIILNVKLYASFYDDDKAVFDNCICDAPNIWIDDTAHYEDWVRTVSHSGYHVYAEYNSGYRHTKDNDSSAACDSSYRRLSINTYEFESHYTVPGLAELHIDDNIEHHKQQFQLCRPDSFCTQKDNIPSDDNASTYTNWTLAIDPIMCQSDENSTRVEEFATIKCQFYHRCGSTKIPLCDEKDTEYPEKSDNQIVVFEWNEEDDLSMQCDEINGTKQSKTVQCKTKYRCLIHTDAPPKECDEPISSYVSPRNGTFHEDIALPGVPFVLHYATSALNDTTIAPGWSLSVYARLEDNRLRYGSGYVWTVNTLTKENGLTVVKSGSNEMLFDAEGQLQNVRDLYTKETKSTFGYDNVGRLVTLTDIYGEISTLERDTNGTVTAIVAPTGQRTLLSVDANGDLAEVQYEDTSSYAFEYERHLMTVETEPKGNRFLHFYDDAGNVVKVIDAEQAEWDFASASTEGYGSHTVTRASGDVVVYKNHFLENNTTLTTEKLLPTGDTIIYTNTIDDGMSTTTSCGMQTTNIYKKNADGTLYKDPYTNRRVLESTTVSTPSGLSKITHYTTLYTQDANNTLISVAHTTERDGAVTRTLRDYNQSTQTLTSPLGIVSKSTFDPVTQNMLTTQYADLEPTTFTYDDKGRVIETSQGNRVTTSTYDSKGNLESITDPKGQTTSYRYDLRDRVIETTYADQTTEAFNYDANGNLITRTVPTPADHTFSYNGVNKRTGYTSPEQKATTYTYDKQRRVTKVTKPSQKSIDTTYSDGRVSSITTPEGTTNYNYTCQNNLSSITNASESFSFTYDGTLPITVTQQGVLNHTTSYTHDNNFQTTSTTYANKIENYSYDKDGLLTQSGDYTLTRNPENGLTQKITDGTLTQKRTYNNFGDLKTQKDQVFKLELRRKKARIAKKEETIVKLVPRKKKKKGFKKKREHVTYHYSYDERDRLIKVEKGEKKRNRVTIEEYRYDNNGNRAWANVYGVESTGSYTLDDNLIVYGDNTYRYDDDGYLVEKVTPQGTTTYSYGTMGELREVITPTKSITYQHNALNQRVAKLIDGEVVEKYLWADLTTLLAIYDKDDNLVQRFEYADGRMPVAMTDSNGTKYYLHYDQVGSLRAVSRVLSPDNTKLQVIKEITYDTFGNILTDSNEAFKVPFGFAGGLYDVDTKLTRFGYRDYDAYTGKWTAKDPIGFGGGDSNLYGYVLGDPVNFVDPSGLSTWYKPWTWWSEETSSDVADDALKKAFCAAKKKGTWACSIVQNEYRELCGNSESPCYASWINYMSGCIVGTLKCDEGKKCDK